jgi:polyisoprenoid-binding protein YceI
MRKARHPQTLVAIAALSLAAGAARADKTHFLIDGGGGKDYVSFTSDAPIEQFVGRTAAVSGSIDVDLANVETGSVELTVELDKLDTGIEGRNKHMKSPEYLDTARLPRAVFKSKRVKALGDKVVAPQRPVQIEVSGELTLHGVTRPLTIKATLHHLKGDQWSSRMIGPGDILGVSTAFPLKMSDYGIKVPKMLLLKVADEVQIAVKVNARTQPLAAAEKK